MKLESVYLPSRPPDTLWDLAITNNKIEHITSSSSTRSSQFGASLLLPSLCHPHIHLDKPYLLTSSSFQTSNYSDLIPKSGTFSEALQLTSAAKFRYTRADLLMRGSQLIFESIKAGVTCMRAFVEIDHVTKLTTIEVAIELQRKFAPLCHVQIVAFAQDPIFTTEHGESNRNLLIGVLHMYGDRIEVLGTTPYVETNTSASKANIDFAVKTALKHGMHLDFHLDYNLDQRQEAMVLYVVESLKVHRWNKSQSGKKTVVLGHCTRLTLFDDSEMQKLATEIREAELPISFVGLPTSDLFMMGRPAEGETGGHRPRGTLQILQMIKRYGMNCCMGVNNVGNAFTPWGSLDPLKLASLGVGIYQDGTPEGSEELLGAVSWRARKAIGLGDSEVQGNEVREGDIGPWLMVKNESEDVLQIPNKLSEETAIRIPARQWRTIRDIIWDPPEPSVREILRS